MIQINSPEMKPYQVEPKKFINAKKIELAPYRVTKFFCITISLLLIAHIAGNIIMYHFPEDHRVAVLFNRYFNFGLEANFPTFFSAFILLLASGLLYTIYLIKVAAHKKPNHKYWLFLSIIFLFLCFDEATMIHDELRLTLSSRYSNLPSTFYYAWVIPYFLFFIGVVLYFLKFVLTLPKSTRNLFFLAAFIYVFGAVGLELVEGHVDKLYGRKNLLYIVLQTIEELLEMVGIIVLIHALLEYIALSKVEFAISSEKVL